MVVLLAVKMEGLPDYSLSKFVLVAAISYLPLQVGLQFVNSKFGLSGRLRTGRFRVVHGIQGQKSRAVGLKELFGSLETADLSFAKIVTELQSGQQLTLLTIASLSANRFDLGNLLISA
jgi:hypothetical protein